MATHLTDRLFLPDRWASIAIAVNEMFLVLEPWSATNKYRAVFQTAVEHVNRQIDRIKLKFSLLRQELLLTACDYVVLEAIDYTEA